jgi:hypothetical protein
MPVWRRHWTVVDVPRPRECDDCVALASLEKRGELVLCCGFASEVGMWNRNGCGTVANHLLRNDEQHLVCRGVVVKSWSNW